MSDKKKTLHLVLKYKWFDLIASGAKKTEYREIKPHYTRLLFNKDGTPKHYDEVALYRGYNTDRQVIRSAFNGVRIGYPFAQWCDGDAYQQKHYCIDITRI